MDEVVLDAPSLAHAVGRDDDRRALVVVEALGVLHARGEVQAVEAEGILVVPDEGLVRLLVVALGMDLEDRGRVDRHRAVHPDRDLGDALLVDEQVEVEHQLLRALDREGRDHDLAASRHRLVDDVGQLVHRVVGGLVQPVAVGRLEDEVVHRRDRRPGRG